MKTPSQVSAAGREEFVETYCEKDRALRTRMKARNGISMADGIKSHITSQEVKMLESAQELFQKLIADEMLICRKENTPTSRLTSLWMKCKDLFEEEIKKIKL